MEPWRAGLIALFVAIDTVAILLNLTITIITLKTPHLRRTLGNTFVINLMCADLLVTLVIIPMWIIGFSEGYWIFPGYVCDIYGYAYAVLSYDTIWTTCLISFDRYYSIAYPMLHAVNLTVPRTLVAIVATWVLSGLFAVLPNIYHEKSLQVYEVYDSLCVISYSSDQDDCDVQWILIGVTCYCVPAIIIIVAYSAIFRIARKAKQRVVPRPQASSRTSEVSICPSGGSIWPTQQLSAKSSLQLISIIDRDNKMGAHATTSTTELIVVDGVGTRVVAPPVIERARPPNVTRYIRVGKAARTVICISSLFIGLWLPYFVSIFYGSMHNGFKHNRETIETVATWMGFLTYLANPIVYGYFNQPIRYELKRRLFAKLRKNCADDSQQDVSCGVGNEDFFQFLERTSTQETVNNESNEDGASDRY